MKPKRFPVKLEPFPVNLEPFPVNMEEFLADLNETAEHAELMDYFKRNRGNGR